MRCPDCDYELRDERQVCPRCEFRRAVPAAAPVPPPAVEEVFSQVPTSPVKWGGLLLGGLLLVGAGTGFLRLHRAAQAADSPQAARQQAQEAQVRTLFAAAEAPCRRDDVAVCQGNVDKIRALDDQPDASLLLADMKIAHYLPTLSGGDQLSARWRQDQISLAELTDMGNVACRKGLHVYHSFWICADIKRYDTPVPELIFGGAQLPLPTKLVQTDHTND